ncbi:hypothetical protein BV133_1130 [Blastochloris viridis]|uniref:Uncharacterized protein n=1 Tax=Blastochloris viridis TaxID=1079 RepID=A0A182D0M8_BLAVI|nr:hypothetical protein BV133_1130 [Blastochloris viridis]
MHHRAFPGAHDFIFSHAILPHLATALVRNVSVLSSHRDDSPPAVSRCLVVA